MSVLSTRYMGMSLECPLVVAASPLSRDLSVVRQLEDAGAGAIVLYSLFEEQFVRDGAPEGGAPWEALCEESFELAADEFPIKPAEYLDHVMHVKDAVDIPVIGSLNVSTPGRWCQYAQYIAEAGADALELDIYKIAADPQTAGAQVEDTYVRILEEVKSTVSIPVALKLAPYFSSMSAMAARFDEAGADALVLFNRFYQPTIDVERREVVMNLELSQSADGRLPLMWIAMLKGQVRASLGATGGVHTAKDVVRMVMAGADVAMLCSTLLRHGVERLGEIRSELSDWLGSHGYGSLDEIRGVMSRVANEGSADYVRTGYAKVLNRYW